MALQTIYALFQNVADAERAIGALRDHGVPAENIGVANRQAAEQDETARVRDGYTRLTEDGTTSAATYAPQAGTAPAAAIASTITPRSAVDTPENVDSTGKLGLTTTTPQDAAAGAAVGSGVGLLAGILAAAAAITIPGVGLVLGGGILAGAFGVAAATTAAGAAVGGVTGYLRDMGMPEQAAANVSDRLREGDYLLTASVDPTRYDEIKQVLLKYNAAGVDINVNTAGERVTDVWGNNPVIAEHLRNGPSPAPLSVAPAPVGRTPDEIMAHDEEASVS
ncbi:MAG: hypothetical protein ACRYFS_06430 [Janthinobacterium lividum]